MVILVYINYSNPDYVEKYRPNAKMLETNKKTDDSNAIKRATEGKQIVEGSCRTNHVGRVIHIGGSEGEVCHSWGSHSHPSVCRPSKDNSH